MELAILALPHGADHASGSHCEFLRDQVSGVWVRTLEHDELKVGLMRGYVDHPRQPRSSFLSGVPALDLVLSELVHEFPVPAGRSLRLLVSRFPPGHYPSSSCSSHWRSFILLDFALRSPNTFLRGEDFGLGGSSGAARLGSIFANVFSPLVAVKWGDTGELVLLARVVFIRVAVLGLESSSNGTW